jgi:hypothetical protein
MRAWSFWAATIAVVVALPWLAGADPANAAVEAVRGWGAAQAIGCIGCLAGGVAILTSGWGAIAGFIWSNASMLALAGCAALCADVVL